MNKATRLGRRLAAGASLILLGVSVNTVHAAGLALLTLDHFKETAELTEDNITGTTTIATELGFVERTGVMRMGQFKLATHRRPKADASRADQRVVLTCALSRRSSHSE